MDRKTRFFIVLIFLINLGFGQCKKNYIEIAITKDSCKQVVMSPDKWAYYYQSDKNLKAVKDSLPNLVNKLDTERSHRKKLEVNLKEQLSVVSQQNDILLETREDCITTLSKLEIENAYMSQQLKLSKKIRWLYFGVGVLGTSLIFINL